MTALRGAGLQAAATVVLMVIEHFSASVDQLQSYLLIGMFKRFLQNSHRSQDSSELSSGHGGQK